MSRATEPSGAAPVVGQVFGNSEKEKQIAKALRRVPADRLGLGWVAGLAALLLMAMTLSGCNTVEGMGEDVSAAGGAMSDTADDAKDQM